MDLGMAGILGVIFFFSLLLAVSVAIDARKTGRSALGWFIAVAIFGLFGVALYAYDSAKNPSPINSLRVTGDVIDQGTMEKSTVALNTSARSVTGAENQFIEKCSSEGYQVKSGSLKVQSINTGADPAEAQSKPFRPGKNLLPDGRIKSGYENTHWKIIIFSVILSTILVGYISIFIISNTIVLIKFFF